MPERLCVFCDEQQHNLQKTLFANHLLQGQTAKAWLFFRVLVRHLPYDWWQKPCPKMSWLPQNYALDEKNDGQNDACEHVFHMLLSVGSDVNNDAKNHSKNRKADTHKQTSTPMADPVQRETRETKQQRPSSLG